MRHRWAGVLVLVTVFLLGAACEDETATDVRLRDAVTTTSSTSTTTSTTSASTTTTTTAPPSTSTTAQTLSNSNTYTNSDGDTVHSPAYTSDGNPPAGATARCNDGSYSFSKHRSGTCSHHGGVSAWF